MNVLNSACFGAFFLQCFLFVKHYAYLGAENEIVCQKMYSGLS